MVLKSLFQSARKELLPRKGTSAKAEAPPTNAKVSGDSKLKKKAKTGSSASSKKRKIAPDSIETDESDPFFEAHEWVPAAKRIPEKKKKRVVPAPSPESDSSKLPSDTVQDVKAMATELAAGLKDGDEEKAIRAESAHASALEVSTVELVKCSSTPLLNRLNHGFTIFSFLQSLDQANNDDWRLRTRANSCDSGSDGRPTRRFDGLCGRSWGRTTSGRGYPRKSHEGDPPAQKRAKNRYSFPRSGRVRTMQLGTTWPVIAVKDSTSFSNPDAAEEALKALGDFVGGGTVYHFVQMVLLVLH